MGLTGLSLAGLSLAGLGLAIGCFLGLTAAASATPATANPSNRRPIWPFDIFMPLALP